MSKIPDYQLEAIADGRAVRTNDPSLRDYISRELAFLEPVWGSEIVGSWVNDFWEAAQKHDKIVYWADESMTIAQWLPQAIIPTYRKMLDDFKAELRSPEASSSDNGLGGQQGTDAPSNPPEGKERL